MLVDKGNHRHFMAKEIAEQPEVDRPHAGRICRFRRTRHPRSGEAALRFQDARPHHHHRLRHRLLCRARRQILVRARGAACRPKSISPRSSATAKRRCRRTASPSSSRNRARPPIRWRRCAIASRKASTRWPSSTCRNRPSRAKAKLVFRTFAGPEIGVASTKAFTCQLTALACLAILAGKLRGTITREQEKRTGRRADRGAAPHGRNPQGRKTHRHTSPARSPMPATCSISAAASTIRSRLKAR